MSTGCIAPESCPFREQVCNVADDEVATCSLLGNIIGIENHPAMRVGRDACDACCDSYPPSQQDLNPVVASLLFELSEQIADAGGVTGCDRERAQELNRWAEQSLPAVAADEDDCIDIGRRSYAHLKGISPDTIAKLLPRPAESNSESKSKAETWAVGITTAPRRLPTLEQCALSIIDSGWSDPILFIDGDVAVPASLSRLDYCRRQPALGAFPNYALSLAELFMRDPHADAYMMIQDDAMFLGVPAMRQYLQSVLWPLNGPSIASLYCSRKYNQQAPGWHKFPANWVWGAVAFVFSRDAVTEFLTSPLVHQHRALPDDQGLSKVDVLVGQFATAANIPVLFPSPSLVQHIGTVSTIWNFARAVNARQASQFLGDLIRAH